MFLYQKPRELSALKNLSKEVKRDTRELIYKTNGLTTKAKLHVSKFIKKINKLIMANMREKSKKATNRPKSATVRTQNIIF